MSKNTTFRSHPVERLAIIRAAKLAGKTVSEYCREVMVPYAYSDLGERRPALPPLERASGKNMIAKAAAAMGLTVRQYERREAEKSAARQLGLELPEHAPIVRPRTMPHEEPATGSRRRPDVATPTRRKRS
jgi:hypothetical protein